MELQDFLDHVGSGAPIVNGSDQHTFMHGTAQTPLRIVAELNDGYHSPDELRALLSQLTGSRRGFRHGLFRRSPASSARTWLSVTMSSSAWAAGSRTRGASPSGTAG